MTVKMLVPFVHIVGVLLLFVGLGVEWVAIRALSRSSSLLKAQRWARRSVRWQVAAAAVILASGVAMAVRLELFHVAWVNMSLVVLLLIAALAVIAGRSRRHAADLRIGQLRLGSVAIRIVLALGVSLPDGGEVRDCRIADRYGARPRAWNDRGDQYETGDSSVAR